VGGLLAPLLPFLALLLLLIVSHGRFLSMMGWTIPADAKGD
jgi:hypothetical protein